MTVQLLLIRHAQPYTVDHDPAGADPGLAPVGKSQADMLAGYLAESPFGEITHLVSSTMRRAIETAQPLAKALGLPLTREPRLVEVDSGWKNYGTGLGHYPNRRAGWDDLNRGRLGDNEFDLDEFRSRVVAGMDEIATQQQEDSVVGVVCHGGVISAYLAHILGTPRLFFVDTAYTSITRVQAEGSYREVLSVNETDHFRRN
ncbi:histidine phosphatase family protein [Rhodococcus aetherivorans]|uniref:histidine phosphatase family protein n=1 Tax=Rhodococcus aetherivorans TaxID=191292 RepID=UPI003693A450